MLFLFILFLDNIWKRSVKPYYSSLNTSLLDSFLFMSLMLSVKWKKGPRLITTIGIRTVTLQQGRESTEDLEASLFPEEGGLDFCQRNETDQGRLDLFPKRF